MSKDNVEHLEPVIKTVPAKVDFDFSHYTKKLDTYIDKYNIVVTEETVADAKKAATELNKLSEQIRIGLKEHIDKIKEPADTLGKYSRELREKCQMGRKRILEQVEAFDQKQLDKAKVLLEEFKQELYAEHDVNEEFQTVSVESLVKLGALTSTGKLAKQTRNQLESMVQNVASLQSRTEARLAKLESESYKAGLAAPLTRDHIEAFLFADNETYSKRLEQMLEREKERDLVAREKYAPQPEPEFEPEPVTQYVDVQEEATAELPEPELDSDSHVVVLSAVYEIQVDKNITANSVRMSLMSKLIQLGVKPQAVKIL